MKKGFTLIELVISIFILSVAVIGVFSAFSVMVILTSDTADRLTAAYLAQEGMEIVRNIRDTNWLNINAGVLDATWVDGLTSSGGNYSIDCSDTSVGCKADYTYSSMVPYAANDYLYLDGSGFYVYNPATSPTPTKFERKIIITPIEEGSIGSGHIIKVTVQVAWNQKANILSPGYTADQAISNNCDPHNCFSVDETLYDWYNYTVVTP
jgi:prepilin-type N-terminal cleavage/methylation domain-containing protein